MTRAGHADGDEQRLRHRSTRGRWVRHLGAGLVTVALLAGCSSGSDERGAVAEGELGGDTAAAGSDVGPFQLATATLDLADSLQLEVLWWAALHAGADQARAELDAQRRRTDEALAVYRDTVAAVDDGPAEAIAAAESRMEMLGVLRTTQEDGRGTSLEHIEPFLALPAALVDLVVALPGHAADVTGSRQLQLVAEVARFSEASAKERILLTLVVGEGRYVRWEDGAPVPCAVGATADGTCPLASMVADAEASTLAAGDRFGDTAGPHQKVIWRDTVSGMGDTDVVDALRVLAETGESVTEAVTLDVWLDLAVPSLGTIHMAEAEILASIGES